MLPTTTSPITRYPSFIFSQVNTQSSSRLCIVASDIFGFNYAFFHTSSITTPWNSNFHLPASDPVPIGTVVGGTAELGGTSYLVGQSSTAVSVCTFTDTDFRPPPLNIDFSPSLSLRISRTYPAAVVTPDGYIIVAGGGSSTYEYFALSLPNFVLGTTPLPFVDLAPATGPRKTSSFNMACDSAGNVIAVVGQNVYRLNRASNKTQPLEWTWTTVSEGGFPIPVYFFGMLSAISPDNLMLTLGGTVGTSSNTNPTNSVIKSDNDGNSWVVINPPFVNAWEARSFPKVALFNNIVFVTGGETTSTNPKNDIYYVLSISFEQPPPSSSPPQPPSSILANNNRENENDGNNSIYITPAAITAAAAIVVISVVYNYHVFTSLNEDDD